MNNSFFWHDYETFGVSPRTDRPAQFAGVRTDLDLNEIEDPVMLYCKPSLDTLPSPESCLITGITPQYCLSNGVSEREFSVKIERELAKSNTIGVGFNNIRFDDEFTRYLFWRNLTDPYAREWKNGCSRWDLMDVVRALYALKPNAISWPRNNDGTINFKLEMLTRANKLAHESAHDALSDVRATINLARLIKKVEPRFFEYCLALRNKEKVRDQLSLHHKRPLLHVSSMYGVERSYLAVVWPLAIHPINKNEIIVWDLQADPKQLENLTSNEIKIRMFTRNDELPPDHGRLPIKTISLNKSPFVANDLRVLANDRACNLGINFDNINKHVENAKNLKLHINLWRDIYTRPAYENPDVDEDLYSSFVPDMDRRKLDELRVLDSGELLKTSHSFQDSRLNELIFRYRARNFPDSLSNEERERWKFTCHNKISQKLDGFWNDFNLLYSNTDKPHIHILDDLKEWVESNYDKAILHDSI